MITWYKSDILGRKLRTGTSKTKATIVVNLNFLCFRCPSGQFASQNGGFVPCVPCDHYPAKGHWCINRTRPDSSLTLPTQPPPSPKKELLALCNRCFVVCSEFLANRFSLVCTFVMQIEWAKIKAFYFRNENVLLRLPFSLCLQLSAYFDGKVKKSEEDTKTLYEMAGR